MLSGSPSTELVHEHFILDADLESKLDFKNRKKITEDLIDDLLENLKMQRLCPLQIYDAVDANFPGWSFIQPITTSHISGHYFEEKDKPSHIHIDIYSCRAFDWKKVINIIHQFLNLNDWIANFTDREIHFPREKLKIIQGNSGNITSEMALHL